MKTFYTILTNYGKQALADALAAQQPLKILEMGVGDGGGAYYTPTDDQTNLRNERWRGNLNDLRSDDDNLGRVIAEAVIPNGIDGGWYAREIGLYDDKGGLVSVGIYPLTEIPALSSGSTKQVYISVVVQVDNVAAVELIINQDTVMASKEFVMNKGYGTVGSFEAGLFEIKALTNQFQLVIFEAENSLYLWDGEFPKPVPSGSTPASIGGIGDGAWVSVVDAALRSELSNPGGVSLVSNAAKQFNTLSDMQSADWLSVGMIVETIGYHSYGDGGGTTYEIVRRDSLIDDGGSLVSLNDPLLLAKALFSGIVNFKQFGGRGDKTTDDTVAFVSATNYCRSTGCILDISGMKIALKTLSSPINLDGYWIRGNGVPSVLPSLYYDYMMGADKAEEVWITDSNFEGSGIFCPQNVAVFTGKSFQVQDVCMYGNYNQPNNTAFSQSTVTSYPGWSRALQDTRVTAHYFGCFGIELKGGLEACSVKHVKIAFCKKNCLLVGMTDGINCPIEYIDFDNTCYFMYSKNNNVLLNGFRKHAYFDDVLLNGPGQYNIIKQQDPTFTIVNPLAAVGAVSVVSLPPGDYGGIYHNASYAFRMNRCFGEDVQNLLTVSGGFTNDITLTESTTYPVNAAWPQTHLIVYSNTSYIKTYGNESPDSRFYVYLVPEMLNSLVSVDFGEETTGAVVNLGGRPKDNIRILPNFSSKKLELGDGAGGGANVNLTTIFPEFSNPEFVSAKVMVFTVTATYQWGTLNDMGAYIVFVTRMPSGDWKGIVMSSGVTNGFAAPPSVQTNGDFSMDIAAGYRVSITRIDGLPSN